jgi:hypothetical protein
MGAVHARIEPLATEQQLQYDRMMGQWVALYRHLISQRLLVLDRVQTSNNKSGAIERQQLARLSALVDEMQAALRESDRQKTEQLNNQLLDALRSYDSAPPPIIISSTTPSVAGGYTKRFRSPLYRKPRFSYQTKDLGWTYRF